MKTRNTITVTIYGNREHEVCFPARWIICPECEGHATTTRHIECDGGGFTAEEFDRACHDDEDFADKYFGGFYDRPCEACKGKGRIHAIDRKHVTGRWHKKLLAEYDRQERDSRETDAIHAMERRMGA